MSTAMRRRCRHHIFRVFLKQSIFDSCSIWHMEGIRLIIGDTPLTILAQQDVLRSQQNGEIERPECGVSTSRQDCRHRCFHFSYFFADQKGGERIQGIGNSSKTASGYILQFWCAFIDVKVLPGSGDGYAKSRQRVVVSSRRD